MRPGEKTCDSETEGEAACSVLNTQSGERGSNQTLGSPTGIVSMEAERAELDTGWVHSDLLTVKARRGKKEQKHAPSYRKKITHPLHSYSPMSVLSLSALH